jgi:hypothetical protein
VPTTVLSPAELRTGLQELLALAEQSAALEARIESKAREIQNSDWEFHGSDGESVAPTPSEAWDGHGRGSMRYRRPPSNEAVSGPSL